MKIKSIRIIYLKQLVIPTACILFILCLIIFSSTAVSSAVRGIELWLTIVFPSLFPFFVGSEILNKTGFVKAIGVLLEPVMRPLFNVPGCGSFALAMGVTSGYPVGAKITAGLREEKMVSKREAERLLTFTNNSGPLFIIGAVSVGMLKMSGLGLFLLTCHIMACITVGILFRFYKRNAESTRHVHDKSMMTRFKRELVGNKKNPSLNLGTIFGEAVKSSIMTMLVIGGFIIFFSVIINLLIETGVINHIASIISTFSAPLGINKSAVSALLSGFFEITTGTNMLSKLADMPIAQKLPLVSMIIGWAGLSVHAQVLSIISHTDISIKPYLLGKFMQGIFAGIYTFIGIKVVGSLFLEAKPVFSTTVVQSSLHWYNYLVASCENLLTVVCTLIIFIVPAVLINYINAIRK